MDVRIRKTKKLIERVRVTGPIGKMKTAIKKLYVDGYHVTRSGPKQLSLLSVDTTKFVVIAEKEIEWTSLSSIALTGENRIIGAKLIEVEYRTAEGHNASGGEEVWMNFDNGGELLIYQCCDGTIYVEGD